MGRLDAIRKAERPKMHGRAMISGPSGAGKTWTALGIATVLAAAEDRPGSILVIDTEKESALTYADVFTFEHLPWRPPFDPNELADTYGDLGDRYAVVLTDSFSHFWRGQGGTLDIADGKIGGWKTARPVQEALIQALLSVPAHQLVCVRSKMEYLVEGGSGSRQTVTKMGMAPIQDDTLVYEVNIALDLDAEHRITVTKSRTPAVPVGRMYPAGLERKAAEDYAEWLAGGVPPANREDVDRIVGRFGDVADAERRKTVKAMFVECFGMPHSLTAAQVAEASAWLDEQLSEADDNQAAQRPQGPGATDTPETTPEAPSGETSGQSGQPDADPEGGDGATDAEPRDQPPDAGGAGAEAAPPEDPERARQDACIAFVKVKRKPELVTALSDAGLSTAGNVEALGLRLCQHLLDTGWQPEQAAMV